MLTNQKNKLPLCLSVYQGMLPRVFCFPLIFLSHMWSTPDRSSITLIVDHPRYPIIFSTLIALYILDTDILIINLGILTIDLVILIFDLNIVQLNSQSILLDVQSSFSIYQPIDHF